MHAAHSLRSARSDVQHLQQQRAPEDQARPGRTSVAPHAGPPKLKRPDSGFFAEADPKGENTPSAC
jgi:hypothetical protein